MQIDIITIFPNLFTDFLISGIVNQAQKSDVVQINILDLRNFTTDKYRQIDDRPFGGGVGMVLMPEPLSKAIESVRQENSKVVFLTPSGITYNQTSAETFSKESHLILLCGRYEGIDQRIIDKYVDYEISIGDYILSGGEVPAMVIIDSIVRLIPGAIKNEEFNNSESFSNPSDRNLLDYPQYTRPADFNGMSVPEVLLSGNHKDIANWREKNRATK